MSGWAESARRPGWTRRRVGPDEGIGEVGHVDFGTIAADVDAMAVEHIDLVLYDVEGTEDSIELRVLLQVDFDQSLARLVGDVPNEPRLPNLARSPNHERLAPAPTEPALDFGACSSNNPLHETYYV